MTNAEARFNKSLRPRKPEGSLGRTAQDVHLDSHTAPELCVKSIRTLYFIYEGLKRANIMLAEKRFEPCHTLHFERTILYFYSTVVPWYYLLWIFFFFFFFFFYK